MERGVRGKKRERERKRMQEKEEEEEQKRRREGRKEMASSNALSVLSRCPEYGG